MTEKEAPKLRAHAETKCDSCKEKAVMRIQHFGEVIQYVDADGTWADYLEDTEGYDAFLCDRHARSYQENAYAHIVDMLTEEKDEE